MTDIAEEILIFVLQKMEKGEECHFKDLEKRFVESGICSRPTLLKYKNELEGKKGRGERKLEKIIGKDGRPCYVIRDEFIEEVKKLKLQKEIEKMGSKLIEEDKKHQTNFALAWLDFARFLIDSVFGSDINATQVILKEPSTNTRKMIYVLALPFEKIPEKFRDPRYEDFYYLPHALIKKINEWGNSLIGKRAWGAEKRQLNLKPVVKKKIEEQKEEMRLKGVVC